MKHYPKTWSRELRISLYESDARAARLKADLERRTVRHAPLPWLGASIAVGVIDIPIQLERSVMTTQQKTQQKIDYLKGLTVPPRVPAKVLGRFDLAGQFSPGAVLAINVANARGKFLPDANDADFPDETADGIPASDDDSTWAHVKRAQNHLEACDEDMLNAAPTDGPDHLTLAHKHIGEALEMRARAGRLASVGQQHATVRFA